MSLNGRMILEVFKLYNMHIHMNAQERFICMCIILMYFACTLEGTLSGYTPVSGDAFVSKQQSDSPLLDPSRKSSKVPLLEPTRKSDYTGMYKFFLHHPT